MRDRSTAQVAAELRVSPGTIRYHARSGRLPFGTTPGGHRRFDLDEVRHAISTAMRDEPDTTELFAAPSFGDPLALTGAPDQPLNESARLLIDATAGVEEDGDADLWPRSLDPFAGLAVEGEARYPTAAHGVGASA